MGKGTILGNIVQVLLLPEYTLRVSYFWLRANSLILWQMGSVLVYISLPLHAVIYCHSIFKDIN